MKRTQTCARVIFMLERTVFSKTLPEIDDEQDLRQSIQEIRALFDGREDSNLLDSDFVMPFYRMNVYIYGLFEIIFPFPN